MIKTKKKRKPQKRETKLFRETRLGYLMAHEVPLEYKFILEVTKLLKKEAPPVLLIEHLAYRSDDPFFHKNKFWRCFNDYRINKLKPIHRVRVTAAKELYYIRMKYRKYLL